MLALTTTSLVRRLVLRHHSPVVTRSGHTDPPSHASTALLLSPGLFRRPASNPLVFATSLLLLVCIFFTTTATARIVVADPTGSPTAELSYPSYRFFADPAALAKNLNATKQAARLVALQVTGPHCSIKLAPNATRPKPISRAELSDGGKSKNETSIVDSPAMSALFITWSEAAKGGCREYAQLVSQLPALQKTWSTSQNGSLAYFLLAADSSSVDHFGAFDTNRYGNYRRHLDALADSGVARAFTLLLTSRAAGDILTQRLTRESDLDVVVRLVDERGPWNHLLASTGFHFQRWFFFALFLAAAAIVLACTGRLLYTQGWRLNLVVGLYLTVLVYLVTMAAIPLQGYLTPVQCGFHLLFMLPGFIATYCVILRWTRTVGRLYPPTTMVALVSVRLAPCTVVLTLITTTLGVALLTISYSASARLWSVQRAGILTLQYAALPSFVLQLLSSAFLAVRTRCHVNRSPLTSSGLSALRRFTLLVGLLTLGWLLVALALLLTLTGRVVERPSLYLGRIVLHQLGALVLSTIVLIDLSMHRYRDAPTIVTATATSTVTNASVIDVPLNAELSTARSGGPLSFTAKPTKSKLTMAISSSSFFHFTSSSPMVADRPSTCLGKGLMDSTVHREPLHSNATRRAFTLPSLPPAAQFLKRTVGSRSGHQRLASMQDVSPVMSAPSFNTAPGGSSHRNDSLSPLASTPELRFQDDAYFTASP